MGVAFGQAGEFGRVQARVHTGQNGETACRRHGKVALVKTAGVLLVGVQNFVENLAHGAVLRVYKPTARRVSLAVVDVGGGSILVSGLSPGGL